MEVLDIVGYAQVKARFGLVETDLDMRIFC
jgi:hypothetical protein